MRLVIIDCKPPAPGIVNGSWRILDRPRVAVIIRLTSFNLTDRVEGLVVINVIASLTLGHKNVTAIVIIGLLPALKD